MSTVEDHDSSMSSSSWTILIGKGDGGGRGGIIDERSGGGVETMWRGISKSGTGERDESSISIFDVKSTLGLIGSKAELSELKLWNPRRDESVNRNEWFPGRRWWIGEEESMRESSVVKTDVIGSSFGVMSMSCSIPEESGSSCEGKEKMLVESSFSRSADSRKGILFTLDRRSMLQ